MDGIALAGYFYQDFQVRKRRRRGGVKNEQVKTQAQALDTDWSAIESAGAADRMQSATS